MALCKSCRFMVTGFDYFCSLVTYSEMLKTVIKFHRLKYIRGKKKKDLVTVVLEPTGSVRTEEGRGLGASKQLLAGLGGDGNENSTLRIHLLYLAALGSK